MGVDDLLDVLAARDSAGRSSRAASSRCRRRGRRARRRRRTRRARCGAARRRRPCARCWVRPTSTARRGAWRPSRCTTCPPRGRARPMRRGRSRRTSGTRGSRRSARRAPTDRGGGRSSRPSATGAAACRRRRRRGGPGTTRRTGRSAPMPARTPSMPARGARTGGGPTTACRLGRGVPISGRSSRVVGEPRPSRGTLAAVTDLRRARRPGRRRCRPRRQARPAAGTTCASSDRSSSRSVVEPIRRCWPRSPTTCWVPPRAHAVTAVSPSLAGAERDDCAALAAEWQLRWTPVVTHEMERAAYRINDGDRCFHCKAELMDVVAPIAAADGATIVLGVNLDDLGDHRPGQRAAVAGGAVFPLVEAGFTKHDVREASRLLGLRTWDKPAAACLASRVPYGTEVSVPILGRVERAEAALRALGFAPVPGTPLRRHRPHRGRARLAAAGLTRSPGRRGRGRARRRLPVRHARPRGVPVGQPQRRPRLILGTGLRLAACSSPTSTTCRSTSPTPSGRSSSTTGILGMARVAAPRLLVRRCLARRRQRAPDPPHRRRRATQPRPARRVPGRRRRRRGRPAARGRRRGQRRQAGRRHDDPPGVRGTTPTATCSSSVSRPESSRSARGTRQRDVERIEHDATVAGEHRDQVRPTRAAERNRAAPRATSAMSSAECWARSRSPDRTTTGVGDDSIARRTASPAPSTGMPTVRRACSASRDRRCSRRSRRRSRPARTLSTVATTCGAASRSSSSLVIDRGPAPVST